jgi:hypothetical protein
MPRNVFIVLFAYIIVSNDKIQLQISSIMAQTYSPCSVPLCGKTVTKIRLELNDEVMVIIIIINIMVIPR